MSGSDAPPGLVCPACDATYAPGSGESWRCDCGHPLEFDAAPLPDGPPPDPDDLDRDRGLWAFEAFLPVEPRVTLGEGFTPMVDAPAWDATFKLDQIFPSGSFKDRGATATLSRAAELGVERVLEDSSGNAGAATAQYAARAGIGAEIYVPAEAKVSKLRAIERAGADVVRVEGTMEDVSEACITAVEAGEGWYASHAWNPAFFAGTATFGLEVAAQRGWDSPDAVVLPVGHGTLFLGAHRGFRALRDAGWIEDVPRLLGVQATGYAPFVGDGTGNDTPDASNDIADGIHITHPARNAEIREAIETTDGDMIAIDERRTRDSLDRLHRAGFYVEPTCAVAPAALERYRELGVLDPGADVVVGLSGSGLKY
ncbi:MAG: pyridoxal-phosphate dependent enzyme [Halobacteriales archaeon]